MSQVDYASLSGRVTDPSGAVVQGAAVTAHHVDTNLTGATVSDQEGRFRFPYNLSNNFIVDGLSANDEAAGLSGIAYAVDAVSEFQVITSGGQAELGRRSNSSRESVPPLALDTTTSAD